MSRKKNKIVGTKLGEELIGTNGNDVIIGKRGDDIINTFGGRDKIKAGSGDDIISSGEGNDKAWGGEGNDVFVTVDGGKGHVKLWILKLVTASNFAAVPPQFWNSEAMTYGSSKETT